MKYYSTPELHLIDLYAADLLTLSIEDVENIGGDMNQEY